MSDDYFYQQMMASTPMSAHLVPDGAFDAGDGLHHATRPGNQTTLLSPDNNRPSSLNESTTAPLVPELATAQLHPVAGHYQVTVLQHQQQPQPLLHPSALSLGLGLDLDLTHADGGQGHYHRHQFDPVAASVAGQQQRQAPSSLLHPQQGYEQPPENTWLPPGYGVPVYHDSQQQQRQQQHHAGATPCSSSSSTSRNVSIPAAGGLGIGNDSIGTSGHLYDFGFAAPPAIAAAELNHDVRKHSKSSMETDSDFKNPSWDDEENEVPDRKVGRVSETRRTSSSASRRQQRNGKRPAVAGAGARDLDNDGDGDDCDGDEPTSPADRTSISGRSIKSASVASSAGSGSKTAPVPRLRSASRTSKNQSQKPTETLEERRTRASHNLVEKQYRNRLNAQFEGLLNALPEQARGPGDAGDGGESDPQQADQERRVSKAEVLDMARRHIKSLEREREVLHRERGELLRSLETLEREAALNQGGRLDEFLDVQGTAAADEGGESSWRGNA
ncbi:Helix-loop-helix DNA-binding domain-containing protein [Colletotrichum higginsianum IMI 349063]|uniref:Helix-loop-helix DNA-binding domain-containing protein n=1 Tax=Colletotrichum higginsianum (strain IMI 349063) TaxID=759273 RepID=A0A1B7YPI1_COLHI|nr:Helix-loop-helix DNA-binding domain-containing protein [Colletotrichum higginsianum IMI 349063]OBR13923.1 Helix-loop-helix DNA-binding domain-containing protein [Colletotrichum higginsianum IMI 349063]